ncbi:unnamed protein product [Microthlaspi erraticum]|uniref:Myb-like domain-containing protein n=1 Tax=Microthlaspi erraticum TaxID=1685480 RepID=A0A6D2LEL6_9BRAS|nr:unnamed protein product [Microthlaspi erraticum]
MWMATRSDSGFCHGESLSSMMSRHAINFQSNTSSEMIPMGPYLGRSGSLLGMNMINNVVSPGLIQNGNSSNSSFGSVPGVKLDPCEWSTEEQFKLEDGLEKYKDKPSIMKYIKVAATLPDKTVRDVALRCRWMTRKRRKSEEFNGGRRRSSSKERQAGLSSHSSTPSVLPDNMASSYPFLMPFTSSSNHISSEDVSGHGINLLEQNVRAFSQIRANLSSYKVQDNIDLFCQTRNNLITIQNDMNNMPGLMSQMPPLPVTLNDDLSAALLSNSLAMQFNTMQSDGFHMKQEPLG